MKITRKGNFDSMHRVVDHPGKCRNIHGHTYLYEVSVETEDTGIGYGMDFADIKTAISNYVDTYLDHGSILNPADKDIIKLCKDMDSKYYVMQSPDGREYMNPTAENISREMYFTLQKMLERKNIAGFKWISNIRLFETPNCYVDYSKLDADAQEPIVLNMMEGLHIPDTPWPWLR